MKSITAWAICDTDNGKTEPKPMTWHIYTTRKDAQKNANYRNLDASWYPVLEITITLKTEA